MVVKRWLVLGVIVLVFGFLATLARSPSEAKKPAPEFVLPDPQGQVVRLSQLKGKVVMLNVWTTWCPPCRKEMPTMETLHRRFKGTDFVMLAASQDVDGNSTVLPYMQENGFTFPVVLDVNGEIGRKYGVTGYPETFIIDRQGRIVHHHVGFNDWSLPKVEASLRRLMDLGDWMPWDGVNTPGERSPLKSQ
ncbi:MAG: TlpA family protein disulfide reductase [Deltaproteobacteria bacterium]|nr:TlpA family protein disulfide reductase [Deltaproteobacteria bacterium]